MALTVRREHLSSLVPPSTLTPDPSVFICKNSWAATLSGTLLEEHLPTFLLFSRQLVVCHPASLTGFCLVLETDTSSMVVPPRPPREALAEGDGGRKSSEGENRLKGLRKALDRCHNLGVVPARSQTRVCDQAEVQRQKGSSQVACPFSVPLAQCIAAMGSLKPPLPVSLQVEPPELPEDLKHWITYNETSSQLLRAESGLSDRKDQ